MKNQYQSPQAEYITLVMKDSITTDDTELGVESNPFLQAVQEDEAQEQ